MSRQLISSDEAVPAEGQHTAPCADCPWARTSLKGWLGGPSADDWLREAHGDHEIPCHVLRGAQCAGAATYRRNVRKLSVNPGVLLLGVDRVTVFATPDEFRRHHEGRGEDFAPTPETNMPKVESVAANLKIGQLKAKQAEQAAKTKERYEKAVAAEKARTEKAVKKAEAAAAAAADRVVKDMTVLDYLLRQIKEAEAKTLDALKAKVGKLAEQGRRVCDKHLPDGQVGL